MNIGENIYKTERQDIDDDSMRFYFFSNGEKEILKIIEYQKVGLLKEKSLFNLGFGDYNWEEQKLSDTAISDNQDHYIVLNTVLSTIPIFFEKYPHSILLVQGSDSTLTFIENCERNCTKNCQFECKKAHRRINLYKRFIERNYLHLSLNYKFYSGAVNMSGLFVKTEYLENNDSKIIFIEKIV